jgi:hypothetical protein
MELAAYQRLAGHAVVGLIFGLLAPLALVDPLLWGIPVLGAILSVCALRHIRKNAPALTGRKLAIVGLTLSLLFAAAAPTDWLVYRRLLRDEAQQFSTLWFRLLTQDEPQKAFQLTLPPPMRHPLDDQLWDFYRNDDRQRKGLESYVKDPLVRTLLALGPKAQVRFYDTVDQICDSDEGDVVIQCYAVTYEEEGEKKSFFVTVNMLRRKFDTGEIGWRMGQTLGGVRPEGW